MNLAVLARRLGVLWASFQSLERVAQQILAIGAKLAFGRPVFATAVDMHKLLQNVSTPLPFVHIALLFTRANLQLVTE
jgi:hypothetical protein